MAAYRRVYDSRYLQADCKELGSAPEPYAGQSSTGCLYLFNPDQGGGVSAMLISCGRERADASEGDKRALSEF